MTVPLIVFPVFCTESVTSTSMVPESGPAGGGALLPGAVVKPPQSGATLRANPLKLGGALPPVSEFSFHHCAPERHGRPDDGVSVADHEHPGR